VNVAGTYYVQNADGTVGAVTCPVDTYSPGLKRQRACVPCPTGYTTFGVMGATSPTQCSESRSSISDSAAVQQCLDSL